MMGFGNSLSPYLGMPWVKTAQHLLSGKDVGGSDPHSVPPHGYSDVHVEGKLPKPKLPPNATHTQLYVTHIRSSGLGLISRPGHEAALRRRSSARSV